MKMASKCGGETAASESRSAQRERERERRRMRDRQRRQNMSLEQRERHLARRRRNYQLRRMRAENSKLQNLTPSEESQEKAVHLPPLYNNNAASGVQIVEKSVSAIDCGESGIQRRPRRLRMHQIRQLARLLPTVNGHQIAVGDANPSENSSGGGGGTKRLRLVHIKRLARALKSHNNNNNSGME